MEQAKTTPIPMARPDLEQRARLTVVGAVCRQGPDEQPVAVEVRYGRISRSDEQPYQRGVKVGEAWQAIDAGWLGNDVGLLTVANREGRFVQVIPTAEERDAASQRVIEIGVEAAGVVVGVCLVPPGETAVLSPVDVTRLRMRCRCGEARVQ